MLEAYDDLFGLGYTKPLRKLLKHLTAHLLLGLKHQFKFDDLDDLPETNDPDESKP